MDISSPCSLLVVTAEVAVVVEPLVVVGGLLVEVSVEALDVERWFSTNEFFLLWISKDHW